MEATLTKSTSSNSIANIIEVFFGSVTALTLIVCQVVLLLILWFLAWRDKKKFGLVAVVSNNPLHSFPYEVYVLNGKDMVIVDASVAITGDNGSTPYILLRTVCAQPDSNKELYLGNSARGFYVKCAKHLGSLTSVTLKLEPDVTWVVKEIVVVDLHSQIWYLFRANSPHVAIDDATRQKPFETVHKFSITTETKTNFVHNFWELFKGGHLIVAIISVRGISFMSRCQKALCCVAFIQMNMAITLILFNLFVKDHSLFYAAGQSLTCALSLPIAYLFTTMIYWMFTHSQVKEHNPVLRRLSFDPSHFNKNVATFPPVFKTIAWVLVLLTLVSSACAVVGFTVHWGLMASLQWLSVFAVNVLFAMLILEILRISAWAVLYSFMIQRDASYKFFDKMYIS